MVDIEVGMMKGGGTPHHQKAWSSVNSDDKPEIPLDLRKVISTGVGQNNRRGHPFVRDQALVSGARKDI